jgi:hypothetical protein
MERVTGIEPAFLCWTPESAGLVSNASTAFSNPVEDFGSTPNPAGVQFSNWLWKFGIRSGDLVHALSAHAEQGRDFEDAHQLGIPDHRAIICLTYDKRQGDTLVN